MKRKNVKFNIGNQPCSVWRITLVNVFASHNDYHDGSDFVVNVDLDPSNHITNIETLDIFRTFFVFGVDLPSALSHLTYDRNQYRVYKFDRLRYLPYDATFEL